MPHRSLIEMLPTLASKRQLCLVGAAVVDIVAEVAALPTSGADIELKEKGLHVGGCALNIAIALKKLGLESLNALPIGKGKWADVIETAMAENGLSSDLLNYHGDNGWCMALVEPNGERTFLSVSGVENDWDQKTLSQLPIEDDAILYFSGYQLSSDSGEVLVSWLESLPTSIDVFIDFGPRIADVPSSLFQRLVALKPIVSLNRQEAEVLGMTDINRFVQKWDSTYSCPLILRIDSDGALFSNKTMTGNISPFSARVVDTIGAGDTHAGGVLAGLSSGWDLVDAVLLGNAVASYVVSHSGGDCAPTIPELTSYLNQY
ncbi:PfkB family carbohydrate kinase [Vibrio sp. VB16]|uniref:PfkB family carbohydrate kinase n=1 Tax=Vibrio sp. VB16 TaxID=2785746 RepID=UPI00189E407E|nr:PfkB family carbohydrate kinase [Vibrio sp. VB16]UGA53639.1 PfkB family carbohydrate kinase [Vibrio sp. VB16]